MTYTGVLFLKFLNLLIIFRFTTYFHTCAWVGWFVNDELKSISKVAITTTTMFSGIVCEDIK